MTHTLPNALTRPPARPSVGGSRSSDPSPAGDLNACADCDARLAVCTTSRKGRTAGILALPRMTLATLAGVTIGGRACPLQATRCRPGGEVGCPDTRRSSQSGGRSALRPVPRANRGGASSAQLARWYPSAEHSRQRASLFPLAGSPCSGPSPRGRCDAASFSQRTNSPLAASFLGAVRGFSANSLCKMTGGSRSSFKVSSSVTRVEPREISRIPVIWSGSTPFVVGSNNPWV